MWELQENTGTTAIPGAWFVENGVLHGENLSGADVIRSGDISWKDYKLSVDVMLLEQNIGAGPGICFGIYLRCVDCNNTYGSVIATKST